MSDTRIHLDAVLSEGASLELPEPAFRHLVQVLRMQAGAALTVFNGQGGEYDAVLEDVAKRGARLRIGAFHDVCRESPLALTLVQGISKGERMDWTLQKAVELGVSAIVPVVTERCNVHLDRERQDKKTEHWRGVLIAACEQSGRTRVPQLHAPLRLSDWLGQVRAQPLYLLDPRAATSLCAQPLPPQGAAILVGPEGGLSEAEIRLGVAQGGIAVSLGPRVLRTETAGMVALSVMQARAGDLR